MAQYKYDLKERTLNFSMKAISLCKSIKLTIVIKPLIEQLIRSSTSIGANYCEATNASSKKDFRNKIFICKKEAEETKYWLMILKNALSDKSEQIRELLKETQELLLIFQKIILSTKEKDL